MIHRPLCECRDQVQTGRPHPYGGNRYQIEIVLEKTYSRIWRAVKIGGATTNNMKINYWKSSLTTDTLDVGAQIKGWWRISVVFRFEVEAEESFVSSYSNDKWK